MHFRGLDPRIDAYFWGFGNSCHATETGIFLNSFYE